MCRQKLFKKKKRKKVKQESFNTHFADVIHNGEDDWEVRLIDQTDNVEDPRKKETFWQHGTWTGYFSGKWIEGARSGSFLIFNLSSFSLILTHNIYCNRWQWHAHLYLKDLTLFICLIHLSTLSTFYIVIFSFLIVVFYYCHYSYLFTTIMNP